MTGARITVYPDGPLVVRGDFVVDDLHDGPVATGRTVALCRCGRSARKPLCDGSHAVPTGKPGRRTPEVSTCTFGELTIRYDSRVLEPRPWTLAQSEWGTRLAEHAAPGAVLELCAGAGQIGLAAAVAAERDLVQIEADPTAAEFARANAETAGWSARTDVRTSPMQTALRPGESFPIVLADPPYLRSAEVARWPDDPASAIDGGDDGLDVVRTCLSTAAAHLAPGGHLLLQVAGPVQARVATELARALPQFASATHETLVIDDERAVLLLST